MLARSLLSATGNVALRCIAGLVYDQKLCTTEVIHDTEEEEKEEEQHCIVVLFCFREMIALL